MLKLISRSSRYILSIALLPFLLLASLSSFGTPSATPTFTPSPPASSPSPSVASVSPRCLEQASLKALDLQYEEALRTGDPEFIQNLLLDNFVWVHNHAVSAETKEQLVGRLGPGHEQPVSRESDEVEVRRAGHTAVITGFTTVEKTDSEGNRRASRYHFIRTYVAEQDRCRLLAGQTMKVWSSEGDPL